MSSVTQARRSRSVNTMTSRIAGSVVCVDHLPELRHVDVAAGHHDRDALAEQGMVPAVEQGDPGRPGPLGDPAFRPEQPAPRGGGLGLAPPGAEERRVGKAWGRTCKFWWSPYL